MGQAEKGGLGDLPTPSVVPRAGIMHSTLLLLMAPQKRQLGTSLVAQWLRIRLPMQGTRVRALVQEDPTCHGATKPVRHSY